MQSGKYEVAGQGGLDGDSRRLLIADLADHNNVRVLTQKTSQGVGESKPRRIVDFKLVNAGDVAFDGILNRTNVDLFIVQFRQGGVQGCIFSGTGRPGSQNNTIGGADDFAEFLKILIIESQRLQAGQDAADINDTNDDLVEPRPPKNKYSVCR